MIERPFLDGTIREGQITLRNSRPPTHVCLLAGNLDTTADCKKLQTCLIDAGHLSAAEHNGGKRTRAEV